MFIWPEFMFLSSFIPNPYSIGKNIDVNLQLLIYKLNQLWLFRDLTYDVKEIKFSYEDNFNMDYK